MECLLCIAAVYVSGSLGIQNLDQDFDARSNDYDRRLGTVALTVDFNNNLFIRATHISGVDTEEFDHGLNSVEIGGKIFLWERK